ncbi:MAG TPA: pyridoxal-phosphate dependent enzyme [Stellaceae bacterium]|nr:pyridoxal-phosphate dependent enzyme [Stellaceae bacterium]
MRPRLLEPFQDEQPPLIGQCAQHVLDRHIDNFLINEVGVKRSGRKGAAWPKLRSTDAGSPPPSGSSWYAGAVRVVGVEPEAAPTLTRALAAGAPVDAEAGGIAADSLAPRRIGERVFPIARQHVERVVLVEDAAIEAAQRALWEKLRLVAEPGAAVGVAALLSGRYRPDAGERVGVVISGGNTTAVDFARPRRAAPSRPAPSGRVEPSRFAPVPRLGQTGVNKAASSGPGRTAWPNINSAASSARDGC